MRKKIGGADNYDITHNLKLVYNFFSYLLLYISYIIFCIATIILLNACFNLNNLNNEDNKPIFEYLKTNNMYIDDYLLKAEKNSAIFMTIYSILAISIFAIGCIAIINKLFNIENKKNIFDINNHKFFLAIIPYIFISIIMIIYNVNKKSNDDTLKNFKDNHYKNIDEKIYNGTSANLRVLKNKIIDLLKNKSFLEDDKDTIKYIENNFNKEEAEKKHSILKVIFQIYVQEYSKNDKDKIKYIKHINDYFELLIKDREEIDESLKKKEEIVKKTNYYTMFYIFRLKNNPTYDTDLTDIYQKFDDMLNDINKKVSSYYIAIIVLYVLLFLIIAPGIIYYYNVHQSNIFIIDTLYYFNIGKILISACILAFVIYFVLYYNK